MTADPVTKQSKLSPYIYQLKAAKELDKDNIIYPDSPKDKSKGKVKTYRKLSIIKDPEGKTRIIAIFDYWTQAALKPISDQMFLILKGINEDCTFNQGKLDVQPEPGHKFHSVDLKSATDRLPVSLQAIGLKYLLGSQDKADA